MPKVGRFVTDPRAGAYCQITLDGGEKVIVNHDKGGFKGGLLTIEVSKLMGLRSDRIFACNLDSPAGQDVRARLTRGAEPGSLAATPLEGVAPASSLHVAVFDAKGEKLHEAKGGLELLVRIRVEGTDSSGQPSFQYAPRTDLTDIREHVREGIAAAFEPFLPPAPE